MFIELVAAGCNTIHGRETATEGGASDTGERGYRAVHRQEGAHVLS